METEFIIAIIAVIVVLLLVVISGIKIVSQAEAYVVERLGAYHATWQTGVHIKIPFIDKIVKRIVLKEKVADFEPQPVITKDNVTMQIDTVVFYQITDAKLYTYGVENPLRAIENLTATTLRNILGDLELDHTLTSRDTVNAKIRSILDEATDPWGIKINRVELKNIMPPKEIQAAMEKQMKAERERRAEILRAEGEKASSILVAEGKKESQILEAEAEKQAAILRAEAQKAAEILKAEALKEAELLKATAQKEAILRINEADPQEGYLTLKKLEALIEIGDGQATKIVVPSDLQNIVGLINTIKEAK